MKKILTSGLLTFVISTSVYAQGFYLRLGAGYAFPQAGQTLDGTGQPYNGSRNNATYLQTFNLKGASFAAGMHGFLGAGYMFTNHIGVQLDADLGLSAKKYTFNDNNVTVSGILANVSVETRAKTPVIMTPSLVVQTGGDQWNIYSRWGLALPLNTQITQDEILSNAPGTGALEVDDYTFKIKNSFSLGFAAAAGIEYKLNDKVSLWGELSLLSLSVYTREAELTNVTVNGQNYPLSQVGGIQKITYSKTAQIDSTGTQQPAYSQPFSNVGINVGVIFHLSQASHHHGRRADEADDNTGKPYRRR